LNFGTIATTILCEFDSILRLTVVVEHFVFDPFAVVIEVHFLLSIFRRSDLAYFNDMRLGTEAVSTTTHVLSPLISADIVMKRFVGVSVIFVTFTIQFDSALFSVVAGVSNLC
jgi:hypothetical protein